MNKKVDEEFNYIHDEYLLQCICTEMKDTINELKDQIEKLENDKRLMLVQLYKTSQELDKLKQGD